MMRCLVLPLCLFGCAGTMRDDRGAVHDAGLTATEARDLITNAPLLIPFVPAGWVGNAVKASNENGRVELVGEVVDDQGSPLAAVRMRAVHSRLVTFDLNDDSPVFWEQVDTGNVNGRFTVDVRNTHTVRLEFTKEGFEARDYHFELVRKGGWPWDAKPATTQPVYGQAPIVETQLRVVMRRSRTNGV